MCEYCQNNKIISIDMNNKEQLDLSIKNNGLLNIETPLIYNVDYINAYFKINYCPMCGRKLGG